MKYIIDLEELIEHSFELSKLVGKDRFIEGNLLTRKFLKNKTPVTEITSGEVNNIIYQGKQIIITFNNLPETLSIGNIIGGNNMSIYVKEIK